MYVDDIAPLPSMDDQLGLLLAALNDSTREWRENLERPDVDTICWQPVPGGYSIGALLLHMCECEAWWIQEVAAGGKADPAEMERWMAAEIKQDLGQWPTPPRQDIDWYFNELQGVREKTIETVRSLNKPEHIHRIEGGAFTLRWILGHLVQHDSYHGGQAVMLAQLRPRLT